MWNLPSESNRNAYKLEAKGPPEIGEPMKVTKEMIGAAHDVMLARGDFVLSAAMLEKIYIAMSQAAPPDKTPFDTCPTCESLARAVMCDNLGRS